MERTVTVAAFDAVAVQNGIRVVLRRAAVQKILVKTDDNLQALVATKVESSRLLLGMLPK